MVETATETIGKGDKRKRTDICVACELDNMFSGFNTARKAAWLKLTPLEYASDRKDSQMLLHSIRESKTLRVANDNPTCQATMSEKEKCS